MIKYSCLVNFFNFDHVVTILTLKLRHTGWTESVKNNFKSDHKLKKNNFGLDFEWATLKHPFSIIINHFILAFNYLKIIFYLLDQLPLPC